VNKGDKNHLSAQPAEKSDKRTFWTGFAAGLLGGIVLVSLACLAVAYFFTILPGRNAANQQAILVAATQNAMVAQALTATAQAFEIPSVTTIPSPIEGTGFFPTSTATPSQTPALNELTLAPTANGTFAISSTKVFSPISLSIIDTAIADQSFPGIFSYNSPPSMKLGDTVQIQFQLKPLNPSTPISTQIMALATQITAPGTVTPGSFEITTSMRAELLSVPRDAFDIQNLQDMDQTVSDIGPTEWRWAVTAKKGGLQTLIVNISRLVQIQGQDNWIPVKTFTATINVNVTLGQQILSLDWEWLLGLLIPGIAIPAFWLWFNNRNRAKSKAAKKKSQ
jgi:hypothetical protein